MKKLILIALLAFPIAASAHDEVDEAVEDFTKAWNEYKNSGDIKVIFKQDGSVLEVVCVTGKITMKECDHIGEHIYGYYYDHPQQKKQGE